MGTGRRPLPTAMKELAGNPGHRPLNDSEPQPEQVAPEMPKGMSRAAQREWKNIVPELLLLGVLSNIDGKALAAYCDAYALWEQARKDVNKYGLVVESPKLFNGMPVLIGGKEEIVDGKTSIVGATPLYELKANPAVSVYNTMAKLMKSFLIEFGLTPASRSKLHIEKPAKEDEFEDFMGKRRGKNENGSDVGKAINDAKQNAALLFNTGNKKTAAPVNAGSLDFEA